MADAQHAARALMGVGALKYYVTGFAWRPGGRMACALRRTPFGMSAPVLHQLERRTIDGVDERLVRAYPFWELVRSAASRFGGPVWSDRAWDRMCHSFDHLVADRYVIGAEAVHGFEYTSLYTFQRAKTLGVARVLHLPSLDSKHFERIQAREREKWPELRSENDTYFARRFHERYARRQEEIELADVIIANSTLTARSHILAGASESKVFSLPLAAPVPIDEVRSNAPSVNRPFVFIWAGNFSLGKGAHYALDAWRTLSLEKHVRLDVYGAVNVPERLLRSIKGNVQFHGSVPRRYLFEAYQKADVLLFPTLSDGFGLVVTEAMAHGLPVITTDQAGAADLVNEGNGLIIPAADSAALADAMRWCLDNRFRLAEMRQGALDTARGRQWSNYRHEFIVMIDEALRRAGYSPNYQL